MSTESDSKSLQAKLTGFCPWIGRRRPTENLNYLSQMGVIQQASKAIDVNLGAEMRADEGIMYWK